MHAPDIFSVHNNQKPGIKCSYKANEVTTYMTREWRTTVINVRLYRYLIERSYTRPTPRYGASQQGHLAYTELST